MEDTLVDDYDEMAAEQLQVTYLLSQEVPDICATAESSTPQLAIEKFKNQLRAEYEKALASIAS
ncbi:hypothetical protein ACVRZR_09850 [Streptococcus entericus]|uniref:hypothetical protein n=1 Tax=Streptococcus entericus TaxID=155680 RepID=UPI00037FFB88|nr:hypothetical protein [Streptococcus entericus]